MKPTVTWAELSDDEQVRGANQGSWRGEPAPRSLACDTVLVRKHPKLKGPASWTDGEAEHTDALMSQT